MAGSMTETRAYVVRLLMLLACAFPVYAKNKKKETNQFDAPVARVFDTVYGYT